MMNALSNTKIDSRIAAAISASLIAADEDHGDDGDDSDSHDAMMRSFSLPTRNSTRGFVRPSFGPSVRRFVGPSVTLELKTRN